MMWLSPRLWIATAAAAALIGSHLYAYTAGKATVKAAWDKETAAQIRAALVAEQAARAKEKALIDEKAKLEKSYADEKRKAAAAAASARNELDRLRAEIKAAADRSARANPATPGRAHGPAAFPELLGECAGALLEMGQEADRLKGIAQGLQDYSRNVCRN